MAEQKTPRVIKQRKAGLAFNALPAIDGLAFNTLPAIDGLAFNALPAIDCLAFNVSPGIFYVQRSVMNIGDLSSVPSNPQDL